MVLKSASRVSGRPNYASSVPAVVRALDVLECIRRHPEGATLSQVSRETESSPSSALAVLRTLVRREYLVHDPDGTYRLGPAVAELAGADPDTLAVWRTADAVAELARTVAVAHQGGMAAPQSVLGAAARDLARLLLGEEARSGPATISPWQSNASGPIGAAELRLFLSGDLLATLSCVKDDGYPYSVPVWYHWERDQFWLIPRGKADWVDYVALNPRVSLAISEHQPPLRRVLIEGVATLLPDEASRGLADRLIAIMAPRYLGPRASAYLEATLGHRRQVVTVTPEKLVTWRGLAAHPRYANAAVPSGVAGGDG